MSSNPQALDRRAGEGMPLLRVFLVLVSVALIAVACLRNAVVASEADRESTWARRIWPDHPDVQREQIMLAVAQAAQRGRPLSAATAHQVTELSIAAPLAAEPFAVKGAVALRAGKYAEAQRLLEDARQRDPRQRAVRFLLSEVYLRQEKVVPALQELVVLTRLSPEVIPSVTAVLAAYSKTPGAIPRVQLALRARPDLENSLLRALADDPRNLSLILGLVAPRRVATDLQEWQKVLLSSLIRAGDFGGASTLWRQLSPKAADSVGDFSDSAVESPFTWSLLTSSQGVAAVQGNSLDVQYFGQADTSLASKVIILNPGSYELKFSVTGTPNDQSGVHFLLTCLPDGKNLLDLPVRLSSAGLSTARFEVPKSCGGEKIEFKGLAQVYPTQIRFSISNLALRRLG